MGSSNFSLFLIAVHGKDMMAKDSSFLWLHNVIFGYNNSVSVLTEWIPLKSVERQLHRHPWGGMLLSGGAAGSNAQVCGLSQQLQVTCGVWNKHPKPSCSKMDAHLPAAGAKCPFLACSSAISAMFWRSFCCGFSVWCVWTSTSQKTTCLHFHSIPKTL